MNKIKKIIYSNNMKIIIISTLIFIAITHGFCYMNVLFSHDSIRTYFWTKSDTISIGRYLLPLFLLIRGKYYPPLLIGTLTYFLLIIIIYLLVDLFEIKKKNNIILVSGIITTASSLTLLNATYLDFSDMYVFAILLATIGAYLWKNYKYGFIFAIIPVFLLLPIYQPYITFFTGIVLLLLIKNLLKKKDIKELLFGKNSALSALCTFVTSMILYAISIKVVNYLFHFDLRNSYNSVSKVGSFSSINQIIDLVVGTYKSFFNYIIHPNTYFSLLISIFNILLIVITLALCTRKIIKEKDIVRSILYILFILLIPFVFNFVYILGNGIVHQLMIYSFFLLYIFIIMVNEDSKNKAYSLLITIIFPIILFSNIIYANQCYLFKDLNTKTTLATMNRIINRLELMDNYKPGITKVAFIGNLNAGPLFLQRKEIDKNGVGLNNNFGLTYYKTYKVFFENYLAYPINVISEEEAEAFRQKQEVIDMEPFPSKESIQFVDDTIIIKLSN